MLVSHIHRFIYTKTLKTAGTSVEIYFQDACLPPGHGLVRSHAVEETVTSSGIIGYRGPGRPDLTWYNHMPATAIRDQLNDSLWNEYFKFCVVRNPFDKVVSYWWMMRTPEQRSRYASVGFHDIKDDFSRWAECHCPEVVDSRTYLIDGQPCMDFFMKYERLLEDLDHVCRRVGYPYRPELLGRYKGEYRTDDHSFRDYYTASAVRAVETAFQWELDYFGYSLRDKSTITSG